MKKLFEQPWFRKTMVGIVGRPLLKQFERDSRSVRKIQSSILKKIIVDNAKTVFGKEHGFEKIKTVDEYRKAIPVGDFESHRSYVNRMCKGEADILFTGRPIMYNTTSGTTDKPKLIPVSKEYFDNAYKGLSRLWMYTCLKDNQHLFDGKSLSAVAPENEGAVEDGTMYGSISGALYRSIPTVLKSTYSTPYPIICIPNYQLKYYGMMRFALPEDITYIVCPSSSNLLQFHTTVMNNQETLVRDIHDGTLRDDVMKVVPPADRDEVRLMLAPQPERAKALEALMQKHGADLRPKHYWPNVALLNVWKQGNFARLMHQIDGFYADTAIMREFGYQASEARAGFVLGNDWEYSVLAAHVYHFEFIPEEERESNNPQTLLAHELEVGKRYFILFSNTSGLYRYNINDLVEVTGFYNEFALFRFLQKGEGTTSLSGEKITEEQVIMAVEDTAKELMCKVMFFTMFCDIAQQRYLFYIEFGSETSRKVKKRFLSHFDRRLSEINREYNIKRSSGRLAAPLLRELQTNSHARFKEMLVTREMARDGQYKDFYLRTKSVYREILDSLTVSGKK